MPGGYELELEVEVEVEVEVEIKLELELDEEEEQEQIRSIPRRGSGGQAAPLGAPPRPRCALAPRHAAASAPRLSLMLARSTDRVPLACGGLRRCGWAPAARSSSTPRPLVISLAPFLPEEVRREGRFVDPNFFAEFLHHHHT